MENKLWLASLSRKIIMSIDCNSFVVAEVVPSQKLSYSFVVAYATVAVEYFAWGGTMYNGPNIVIVSMKLVS